MNVLEYLKFFLTKESSFRYGHVSMLLPRSTEAVSCEDEDEEEGI